MTKNNGNKANNEKNKAIEEEITEPIKIKLENGEVINPVSEAEKKANEYKDMLQRLQAEFDNFRKRNAEAVKTGRSDGINDVIIALLPVVDSLERGITSVSDEKSKSGIDLILKQFQETLKKFDVAEIEALDKDFNPDEHYAIAQEENPEMANKVIEIFAKGYRRKDKVLRYAMVKVAK